MALDEEHELEEGGGLRCRRTEDVECQRDEAPGHVGKPCKAHGQLEIVDLACGGVGGAGAGRGGCAAGDVKRPARRRVHRDEGDV